MNCRTDAANAFTHSLTFAIRGAKWKRTGYGSVETESTANFVIFPEIYKL